LNSDFRIFSPEFIDYWKTISQLPEHDWQRWFHTHNIEVILRLDDDALDHVRNDLFLRNPSLALQYPKLSSENAAGDLDQRLKNWSTFPLEDGKCFIYSFKMEEQDRVVKMARNQNVKYFIFLI